ncbi:MAG: hypothetical protein JXB23_14065 [Candidatus Aminicenantes bacterium]|nr:hypothetical protein [Candidatus Aminicenantes bacterium]
MCAARRLGDLDPFTWIRDTREDILVEKVLCATTPRIGTDSKMATPLQPVLPTNIEKPVEITISFREVKGESMITVEISKEGNPPTKINLKT